MHDHDLSFFAGYEFVAWPPLAARQVELETILRWEDDGGPASVESIVVRFPLALLNQFDR